MKSPQTTQKPLKGTKPPRDLEHNSFSTGQNSLLSCSGSSKMSPKHQEQLEELLKEVTGKCNDALGFSLTEDGEENDDELDDNIQKARVCHNDSWILFSEVCLTDIDKSTVLVADIYIEMGVTEVLNMANEVGTTSIIT